MPEAKQFPPLTFTAATPGYVRRAYRVISNRFGVDIRKMPVDDWCPILIAACDHDQMDDFREAVESAGLKVLERRYWWVKL